MKAHKRAARLSGSGEPEGPVANRRSNRSQASARPRRGFPPSADMVREKSPLAKPRHSGYSNVPKSCPVSSRRAWGPLRPDAASLQLPCRPAVLVIDR